MKVKTLDIGGIGFSSAPTTNRDPYIIGLFGEENTGKTRFPLTGPGPVAYLPLEMKSYVTIDKDARELGVEVIKPSDPMALIVGERKVGSLDDVAKQKFYAAHVGKVKQAVFALLEMKEVRIVVIDKFTTFCVWSEYAINGMQPKYVKVEGKVYQSKGEVRQSIIDFVNSLSQYGKTVVLNCASKPDYDVQDANGNPLRDTWDCGCFYMMGSHANLVCELQDNKDWNPKKKGEKYEWHYRLNVRRCQKRPELEGPEGQGLLVDDGVTLPGLVMAVEGEDFDPTLWFNE